MKLSMITKYLAGFEPRYRVTLVYGKHVSVLTVLRTRAELARLREVWTPRGYAVESEIVDLVEPGVAA